ncbi:MAG: FAD-binding protein, partial [Candidatus Sedimenticola sp. (ex Thyasira tokunagai)]
MTDITRSLVEHVREAFEKGSPLNIVGGGSKAYLGREARGEPLQVNDHRGIVSYNPTELVMTARNGTPIEEINRVLAENGQVCPFESPVFEGTATLGGTLAANLSGPARPWSGSIRDAVLGVQLINGKGEQLKFGGQVMKNVAGYDVS